MSFEDRLDELVEERFQETDFEDWFSCVEDKYKDPDSAYKDYMKYYVGCKQYKKDLEEYDRLVRDDLAVELKEDDYNAAGEFAWECSTER